jgi:hypothetical protein
MKRTSAMRLFAISELEQAPDLHQRKKAIIIPHDSTPSTDES